MRALHPPARGARLSCPALCPPLCRSRCVLRALLPQLRLATRTCSSKFALGACFCMRLQRARVHSTRYICSTRTRAFSCPSPAQCTVAMPPGTSSSDSKPAVRLQCMLAPPHSAEPRPRTQTAVACCRPCAAPVAAAAPPAGQVALAAAEQAARGCRRTPGTPANA